MSETRARFLREIAARIPAARLVEIHLFPALKQGAVESGVAIVAATPEPGAAEPFAGAREVGDAADAASPGAPLADAPRQIELEPLLADAPPSDADAPTRDGEDEAAGEPIVRHTVYTARYRATLKGPDRGRWEFSLVAEADAPLVTIDLVVRGVQRRSSDAAEPERLTADSLRAMDDAPWPISTP